MNKQEKTKLEDLIELNKTVLTQYQKLAELEINGQKNSDEYKSVIKILKIIANVISKKIASLNITSEELLEYELNHAKKYNYEDDDILAEVLMQNTSNLAEKRLSMQLFNYSLINHCYCMEEVFTDEEVIEYEEDINDYFEEEAIKELDFELLKERLIDYTFLAYLEEAIKKEENQSVRNILITTKYNIIYLLYFIETNFLKNQNKYYNYKLFQEIITYQGEFVNLEEDFIKPNEETIMEYLDSIASLTKKFYDIENNDVKIYLLSLYVKTLISINISKETDKRLKTLRETIKLKATESKKYIDEAYNISKKLSVVKKVDL